jgi:hypothetical protein
VRKHRGDSLGSKLPPEFIKDDLEDVGIQLSVTSGSPRLFLAGRFLIAETAADTEGTPTPTYANRSVESLQFPEHFAWRVGCFITRPPPHDL